MPREQGMWFTRAEGVAYQHIKEILLGDGLVSSEKVQHLTLSPLTKVLQPVDTNNEK